MTDTAAGPSALAGLERRPGFVEGDGVIGDPIPWAGDAGHEGGGHFAVFLTSEAGSLSHMEGAAVLAMEGCGHALVPLEDGQEGGPSGSFALFAEVSADALHQLVGDHGDEQVPVGALGGPMEDGAQAEFGLERPEDGLHVGERGVGAPERFLVPLGHAGAQAVGAGMCDHGADERLALPGDGAGLVAAVVGDDIRGVVGPDPAALLSEPADPLPDKVEPLVGARSPQPRR